jgi:hypothetical protein
MRFSLSLVCAMAVLTSALSAQVPTFADVSGHGFGERITQHHEMVRYLETLAARSPRVVVREQGETWEGRKLLVAIVTGPENHGRLDEIEANARTLDDPRTTTPAEAAGIMENQPVIVWYGGSIHGFELSWCSSIRCSIPTGGTRSRT